MPSRRTFVKNSSLLTAALLFQKDLFYSEEKADIGLQMYTMRKLISHDNAADIIGRIAAIGFRELEIFAYTEENKFWGMKPEAFKALLGLHGLTAPSAHTTLPLLFSEGKTDELTLACEAAKIIGTKYITVAWLDEKYRKNAGDYKNVATKLNTAGQLCRQYGMQLAYHNHDFEFKQLADGTTGYDIILKNTDKELVKMELDLYWVTKAGIDPVKLFKENPGRFPMWHVKDMNKTTGSFTEVGSGTIDFKRIFKKRKSAGAGHLFIEQDEIPGDVWESITKSYDYTRKNLMRFLQS
ncbi:sugar phosphate isomerase/epimerase [Ferruginibacter sp. HRS2-29]|uniref:sugar phosphate isomerase/epimerase family protein n=1 Tax=Ferruginibacter sp. HRS2-29 TaxID=2487334 RepID=UPI0020CC5A1F|nr:sugar phosphate isomerase/epimerase [Ferruginibacter sp. HRS2-29]MCP9751178.1 sugar phosphate isomerase/epimerase [Ferruginibacter sp. HRS2-29]